MTGISKYFSFALFLNNNIFIRIPFYKLDLQNWRYGAIFYFYKKLKSKEVGIENIVLKRRKYPVL